MTLDVPTLMLTGSFVGALCGVALLVVWWNNRETAALWCAAASLTQAGAVALLAVSFVSGLVPLFITGLTLNIVAPALFWSGMRVFYGNAASLLLCGAGLLVWLVAVGTLGALNAQWALPIFNTAIAVTYSGGTIWEMIRVRGETFRARIPLIMLVSLNAIVLLGAIPYAVGSDMRSLQPPPIASFFGLIHFETIIYLIGTTVSVVALIKERSELHLMKDARCDPLTGLANRRAFHEMSDRVSERCKRQGRPIAVVVFDLDHFKNVNDTYGHAFGDDVLRLFAKVVRESLRPGDVIGRVGGEEFVAVLPDANLGEGYASADRVRRSFAAAAASVGGHEVKATVSAGVMASNGTLAPLDELFETADAALYRAKINGRNRVECGEEKAERLYPRFVQVA